MTPIWYVVAALCFVVAVLFRRLYVLEKAFDIEAQVTAEMMSVQVKMLTTCPGYAFDYKKRAQLMAVVDELTERHRGRNYDDG